MTILCVGLSLRTASWNVRLARAAAAIAREEGAEAEALALRDLAIPLYDADVEAGEGIPAPVLALGERIRAAQGLVLATPEYNSSMAGVAKNAIDWLSRIRPYLFERKPVLALAATPGRGAGAGALASLRAVLEHVDAVVWPEAYGLGRAKEVLNEAGALPGPEADRLRAVMRGWLASLPS